MKRTLEESNIISIEDEPAIKKVTNEKTITIEQHLICPITKELMMTPVTLPCGHTFEYEAVIIAIDAQQGDQHKCPVCSKPVLQSYFINADANYTILNIIQSLYPEQHKKMMKEHNEIRNKECLEKEISDLKYLQWCISFVKHDLRFIESKKLDAVTRCVFDLATLKSESNRLNCKEVFDLLLKRDYILTRAQKSCSYRGYILKVGWCIKTSNTNLFYETLGMFNPPLKNVIYISPGFQISKKKHYQINKYLF